MIECDLSKRNIKIQLIRFFFNSFELEEKVIF